MGYQVKPIPTGYKFAWSVSSMNTYNSCPRRWGEEYVHKNKQPFSTVAQWGVDVHDALEASVKAGCAPLGERYKSFQYVIDGLKLKIDQGWVADVEAEHCMDRALQPTSWFSKEAWVRCKIDLTMHKGDVASVIDYKTGAVPKAQWQSYDQLHLSNLMVFNRHPHINVINSLYWYIAKGGEMSKVVATTRDQIHETWDEFFITTHEMETSVANNNFPAKQNGLCKKHCHVLGCEFNGRKS